MAVNIIIDNAITKANIQEEIRRLKDKPTKNEVNGAIEMHVPRNKENNYV